MAVRIYKPAKTAMQSGLAKTHEWVVNFDPSDAQRPDALMGWSGSGDTRRQLTLHFQTQEEAVAYAEREGLHYDVELPRERKIVPKSYSDNFRFGRSENWTH